MANALTLSCTSCGTRYVLPEVFGQRLEGRAAFCVACERWWVPLPASSGPAVRLVKGRPERAPIDLREYQQPTGGASDVGGADHRPTAAGGATNTGAAAAHVTTRVPLQAATGAALTLRVVISVAATGQSRKGVFDLGTKSFLIGKQGCHLNLPKAAIPSRAIRIRTIGDGFRFEGVDGFPIPIGSVSIVSGQIESGGAACFKLAPYELQLEPSVTPGRPIADLEAGTPRPPAPGPSTVGPSVPVPRASVSAAPTSPAPTAVASPAPTPVAPDWRAPKPPGLGNPGAHDLRRQLQELAIDERPDQKSFNDEANAVQAALDGDQTITDLGAQGFQAMRFGNPLDGLDINLVRADGPSQGQAFKVTKSPLVIGRSGGDMMIQDRRVSSKHAQLDVSGPRIYTLKDLASTNGTSVNDRPVSVGHLQDGDVISFGGVTFDFKVKVTKV